MSAAAQFVPTSASARRTLAEQALAVLYERIMSGDIRPGEQLRLVELAEEMEMSLSPVRESLRRLENLGLVVIEAHKGARVRDISLEDFEDTQHTRLALETIAIELAAQKFTPDDATRARAALDDYLESERRGDPIAARRAHTVFHFSLYRSARSTWMLHAIEPVWENSERYRFAYPGADHHRDASDREHEAILTACAARDMPGAVAALREHITRASDRMRASLLPRLAGTGAWERANEGNG
ncbi:GntR family transcriptional regulator [Microbacterium sp. 18062]|uniref:GntR family transcriptional regulator n=1 Tax=Microbacterium sp. 18062 TaxID=2681410 RepID=UPI00135BE614|nr:GntR family transcriptional regulator [Microbacterium sp. 18062]